MSKERLVDLHVEAVAAWDTYLDMCEEQDVEPEKTFDEFVADYLIANGVIVPPFKIGGKVYQTDGMRIYESTILEIICTSKRTVYITQGISFDETAIGTSIFLTREEAEKALEDKKYER